MAHIRHTLIYPTRKGALTLKVSHTHTAHITHTSHTHRTHIGIECRLSLLETAVGDLGKFAKGMSALQKAAIDHDKLMTLVAEFDHIAGTLDQRVFDTFAALDLLSPAARNLAQEVDDARKKRRAADEVVAPGSGTSTPRASRVGACRCVTTPLCQFRCPCAKAGQRCGSKCFCGDGCNAGFYLSD